MYLCWEGISAILVFGRQVISLSNTCMHIQELPPTNIQENVNQFYPSNLLYIRTYVHLSSHIRMYVATYNIYT